MIKKVLIGFVLFFALLIGALVASTFIFKDEINELVKQQINNELNATVDYKDYDLSILRSFPDFKFSLNDLIVIGQGAFEGDTLALIKELNFNLDAKKMFQEKALLVHSVYVNELNLKAYVLADSTSSLNILKEKVNEEAKIDTATESLINIEIESFIVENSNILYSDIPGGLNVVLKNINIDAEIDYVDEKAMITTQSTLAGLYYSSISTAQVLEFEDLDINLIADYLNDIANVETKTKIKNASFTQEETKYLNNAAVNIDGTVAADLKNATYQLDQNLGINALKIALKGLVEMPTDDIKMNLDFASNQSTFKEFLSLVPAEYLKDYNELKVEGGFALKGSVNGVYNENSVPNFIIDMAIKDGFFKYPSLPTAIDKINMTATVKSSKPDLSAVDLNVPKATFTIENEPIELSVNMLDLLNDSYVDLKAKGKLNLAKVPDFYPIEGLKQLAGNLDADVLFKGKLSDVENEQFQKVDFQGDIKIRDLIYDAVAIDMPVKVKTMNLDFNPSFAQMTNLDMQFGKSDFKANGKLENLINYVLSDGTLKGNLNIQSNKLDLIELMGEAEEESASETTSTVSEKINVPKNIDFTANADFNEVLYDKIVMKNVKGAINVKDEKINLNSVSANLLGGSAKINGSYSTKLEGKPVIDFKYDVKNFDIKQSFEYVNTIQSIAPIAKYLDGNFSSAFSFNSFLEEDFMPDLTMLNGLGNININYASFLNFPLFKSVSDAVKIPLVNNLDKATIKNAWTVFKIEDGKVNVEPFDYEYQDIKMNLFGSNGFDKTIDYTMKLTVPSNKFGNAASVANDWLSKQKIPLLNLSVPKNITFHLNLSGLMNKPNVKITKVTTDGSDKGVVEQIKTDLIDKAKTEANKFKNEAEAKAKAEAERLKKEAEAKIKAEAERLKKEAEAKAKEEAAKIIKGALKDKLPKFGF